MLTKFSQIQQDLIIGTLLGDGHLSTRTKGRTWRYDAHHGEKQKDYLFHKYEILQTFCVDLPKENKKSLGSTKHNSWYFRTKTLPGFAFFGNKFYTFNPITRRWIKDVPLNIEAYLSPRALAFWFMDDGYLKRKWINYKKRSSSYYFNSLLFCTNSFSLEGIKRLQLVLKKLYALNFTLQKAKSKKSGDTQYLLKLSNKKAPAFRELIKPFLYKLDF